MKPENLHISSQITFFYYNDLDAAAQFYEQTMGFALIDDQGWAKIYQVHGNAFLGVVSGEKGHRQAQEENAVLLTVVVDDVDGWYEYLKGEGVEVVSEPHDVEDIQVRGFFAKDPGGYSLEVQAFKNPELKKVFHA
jgi:predicted enzyme related to lactoylglutathione lyase